MGDLEGEEGKAKNNFEDDLFNLSKCQKNYFEGIDDSEFLKDIIFEVKFNLELKISEFLFKCNFEEIPDINNYERIGEEWDIFDQVFDNFCEDNVSSIQAIEKYYSNKKLINLIKARRAYYNCIKEILEKKSNYYKEFVEKIKNKEYKALNKTNYPLIKKARYYHKINQNLDILTHIFAEDRKWFEEDEYFFNL